MFFTRDDRAKAEAQGPSGQFVSHLEQKYGLHLSEKCQQELVDDIQALLDAQVPSKSVRIRG